MNKTILLLLLLGASTLVTGCSENSTGDEEEQPIHADLEFSYAVTGGVNQSDNWESPENNPEFGGHTNGINFLHVRASNGVAFDVIADETSALFGVRFELINPEQGTYTLNGGVFQLVADGEPSYGNLISGSIRLDEVEMTREFPSTGQKFYTTSGSLIFESRDNLNTQNTVTVTAEFTGLTLISNP